MDINSPEYESLQTSYEKLTWVFNDTNLSLLHQQNQLRNGPESARRVRIGTSLGVATVMQIQVPSHHFAVEFEDSSKNFHIQKGYPYETASVIEKEVVESVHRLLNA